MTGTEIGRRFIQAFNSGDLEEAESFLAPELTIVAHGHAPLDREAFVSVMRSLADIFEDAHFRIEEEVDAGATVVQAVTFRGKHIGEYLGVPPSHRDVSVHQIWILHTDGARIVSVREEWDALGLLRQMRGDA